MPNSHPGIEEQKGDTGIETCTVTNKMESKLSAALLTASAQIYAYEDLMRYSAFCKSGHLVAALQAIEPP